MGESGQSYAKSVSGTEVLNQRKVPEVCVIGTRRGRGKLLLLSSSYTAVFSALPHSRSVIFD